MNERSQDRDKLFELLDKGWTEDYFVIDPILRNEQVREHLLIRDLSLYLWMTARDLHLSRSMSLFEGSCP